VLFLEQKKCKFRRQMHSSNIDDLISSISDVNVWSLGRQVRSRIPSFQACNLRELISKPLTSFFLRGAQCDLARHSKFQVPSTTTVLL